jgi:hypothetical protein
VISLSSTQLIGDFELFSCLGEQGQVLILSLYLILKFLNAIARRMEFLIFNKLASNQLIQFS